MRLTDYRFGSAGRPLEEALEAWETDNAVELHIVGRHAPIPEDNNSDITLRLGFLPEFGGAAYGYHTYRDVNLADWTRPEVGHTNGAELYDIQVAHSRQLEGLPQIDALEWMGRGRDTDTQETDTLPFWYADRDAAILYFIGGDGYFPYLRTDLVLEMLDEMLVGDSEARAQAALERATATLTAYYAEGASVDLRNLRDEIGNNTRSLATNERAALEIRQMLRDQQQRLDLLIEQAGAHNAALEARSSFEAMQNHPLITSVRFSGKQLTIETIGLDIEHPTTGQSAYLGQFTVKLNIQSGEIKLTNNDNKRNGHDHPHVFLGGPCFGEMGGTIMELIRAGQLLAAIEMVFVFLGSANIRDDWGRSLSYWMEPNLPRPVERPPITDTAHEFDLVEA